MPSSFPRLHLPMCTIYVNLELFSFSVYHCLKRHGVDGLGDCGQLAPVLIRHTFAGLPRTLLKDFKTAFLSFIPFWPLQVQTESNTLSQEKKYNLLKKKIWEMYSIRTMNETILSTQKHKIAWLSCIYSQRGIKEPRLLLLWWGEVAIGRNVVGKARKCVNNGKAAGSKFYIIKQLLLYQDILQNKISPGYAVILPQYLLCTTQRSDTDILFQRSL